MKELAELQDMGYQFSLKNGQVHYQYQGSQERDRLRVRQLLGGLKRHAGLVQWILEQPKQKKRSYMALYFDETQGIAWSFDGLNSVYSSDFSQVASLLADEEVVKIFYDAVSDVACLEKRGFLVRNYTSIKALHQVCTYDAQRDVSLTELTRKLLGPEWIRIVEIPEDILKESALAMCHLYHLLLQKMEELYLEKVWHREKACLPVMVRLQQSGLHFDFPGWSVVLDQYEEKKTALVAKIREICRMPELDLQSPAQLQTALWQQGAQGALVFEKNLEHFRGEIPVVADVLKYMKLQKQINTFGLRLKNYIDIDGRMRGRWHLIGSNTGRMSCTSPNLQGMPRASKAYFKAAPGHTFVIGDYSQIELRVIAQVSGDATMIGSFMQGEDLHVKTAAAILSKVECNVTETERQIAKAANFGLIYGMTATGLQRRVEAAYGIELTWQQAQQFRDGFFQLYPGILRYQDRILCCKEVKTLGGRCWCENTVPLKQGSTARLNYPIQGTAAEGLKESLILLFPQMKETWKLVAVVHDEVVLEVPEHEGEAAAIVLERMMQSGMARLITAVPIEVDVQVRAQWGRQNP